MIKLIDLGLLIRLSVLLSNAWLLTGLTKAYNHPGTLNGSLNLVALSFIGSVVIIGCALILQKVAERLVFSAD